jgi:hypothetical protein
VFGADRGDELPEHLRTEAGRREAFAAAKERLAKKAGRESEPEITQIAVTPPPAGSASGWGRRTWHREGARR